MQISSFIGKIIVGPIGVLFFVGAQAMNIISPVTGAFLVIVSVLLTIWQTITYDSVRKWLTKINRRNRVQTLSTFLLAGGILGTGLGYMGWYMIEKGEGKANTSAGAGPSNGTIPQPHIEQKNESGNNIANFGNNPTFNLNANTPAFGNLKSRAIKLSDEMLTDLRDNGWPDKMPPMAEEAMRWHRRRSHHFRDRLLTRTIGIRDEFLELKFKDDELEEFLRRLEAFDQISQLMAERGQKPNEHIITPHDIEGVARSLRTLADLLPNAVTR